jgi:hypothetical protein
MPTTNANPPPLTLKSRTYGCLLGLAVGDALGTTLEFTRPGHFEPLSDLVGGGPFKLKAGEWTDDTSMALCLAESLVERRGFDPVDQMQRYCRWTNDGHLSVKGHCFDIGMTWRRSSSLGLSPHGSTSVPDPIPARGRGGSTPLRFLWLGAGRCTPGSLSAACTRCFAGCRWRSKPGASRVPCRN